MTSHSLGPVQLQFSIALAFLACALSVALTSVYATSRTLDLVEIGDSKTRWIDGVRGMAALLVLLNHVPLTLINLQLAPKAFYFSPAQNEFFSLLGSIGVQLFFCITGMLFAKKLLSRKLIDWTDFFLKRVRRIVPAYVLAATVTVIIAIWFASIPFSRDLLTSLPALYMFDLSGNPVLNGFDTNRLIGINWTLSVEWRFYLVLPIVYLFVRRSSAIAMGAFICLGVTDLLLNQHSSWVFFISGAACTEIMSRNFGRRLRIAAHIMLLLSLAGIAYRWISIPRYGFEQWLLVTALFVSLVVARPWVLMTRTFVAMGAISYSFYLFHLMSLFAVFAICNRYFFDVTALSLRGYTVLTALAIVIALAIATISYLWIERPFMRARTSAGAAKESLVT